MSYRSAVKLSCFFYMMLCVFSQSETHAFQANPYYYSNSDNNTAYREILSDKHSSVDLTTTADFKNIDTQAVAAMLSKGSDRQALRLEPRDGGPDSPAMGTITFPARKPILPSAPRLPGEFEPQTALMLSVCDWQPHHQEILKEIVKKSAGHTRLLILHNDKAQRDRTLDWLSDQQDHCEHLSFLETSLDTVWLRDFAPLIAEAQPQPHVFDFLYDGTRPRDDRFPAVWAQLTGTQHAAVRWTLQGGNCLSNGKRLTLMSDRIFQDNYITFLETYPGQDQNADRKNIVLEGLSDSLYIQDLVTLEPLQSEATQHVDMFAAFLAADVVVVAKLDPRLDPQNAAILDRNAAKLAQVLVDGKLLQVHRIEIPPHVERSWSAFTNIILANDLVLMPVFGTESPKLVEQALNKYRELLPGYTVDTINMNSMKKLQGELHCLSQSIPAFATLPEGIVTFADAWAAKLNAVTGRPR